MIQRKDFRIPSTAKSIVEDDILYLTGIANTGLEDLVGDVVTEEALTQICNQIPNHNLHMDHDGTLDGVLGPLTDGWVDSDGVHFKARILQEKRTLLESYLQQGLNMGASISGVCEYESGSNTDIATWQLTEISLTPIPCDQATMGSVEIAKSFLDAVQAVQAVQEKNNNNDDDDEGDNMAENNEEPITIEKVEELINTAFNEKQEDLIETVRGELKSEYEAVLNELKERIETLESQQGEGNNESESEEGGEGESTSTPAMGEGESKADEDDEDEDEKPRKEDEEDKATSSDEEDDEEDEEEDDDKKNLETMIEKAVQKTIRGIFNPKNSPSFKYHKNTEEDEEEQKGYTPRELAQMLTQTRQ